MRIAWPLLLLCGCAQEATIVPNMIVSNNPCIDAVLAEVADPQTIGAISSYSKQADSSSAPLAWARRYPAIGANAEELIAARPCRNNKPTFSAPASKCSSSAKIRNNGARPSLPCCANSTGES